MAAPTQSAYGTIEITTDDTGITGPFRVSSITYYPPTSAGEYHVLGVNDTDGATLDKMYVGTAHQETVYIERTVPGLFAKVLPAGGKIIVRTK
jgi:hypothetical protein